VEVDHCEFSHIGIIGLSVQRSLRVRVSHCLFWDVGYHGVMFQDINTQPNRHLSVENCVFDGCGATKYWQPGALWVQGETNISVTHNEITNVPYYGIRVTGPTEHGINYTGDPVFNIEYNHIHHYGGTILNDFGAVYITSNYGCDGVSQEELELHCYIHARVYNNWLEAVSVYYNGANLLYSDVSASGCVFQNNILRGEAELALYHHCGLDNLSVNNVVHRTGTKSFQHMWGGCEGSHRDRLQSYHNTRNIYLLDNVKDFSMGRPWDQYHSQAPVFQNNMYWSPEDGSMENPMFPEHQNWIQWQQGGNDSGSLWVDPLFRDPQAGDYSLYPESPAWLLGIEEIDTENIGPRESMKYGIPDKSENL